MKQNFPTARVDSRRIGAGMAVLVAIAFFSSACATLSRTAVETTPASHRSSTFETSPRMNINSAGVQELEKLPGIGKVIAERIVEHRQAHGSFRRAEHLMMVRGISDRKFRDLQSLITTD